MVAGSRGGRRPHGRARAGAPTLGAVGKRIAKIGVRRRHGRSPRRRASGRRCSRGARSGRARSPARERVAQLDPSQARAGRRSRAPKGIAQLGIEVPRSREASRARPRIHQRHRGPGAGARIAHGRAHARGRRAAGPHGLQRHRAPGIVQLRRPLGAVVKLDVGRRRRRRSGCLGRRRRRGWGGLGGRRLARRRRWPDSEEPPEHDTDRPHHRRDTLARPGRGARRRSARSLRRAPSFAAITVSADR